MGILTHQRVLDAGSDGHLPQQIEPAGDPARQRAPLASQATAPEVKAPAGWVRCTPRENPQGYDIMDVCLKTLSLNSNRRDCSVSRGLRR